MSSIKVNWDKSTSFHVKHGTHRTELITCKAEVLSTNNYTCLSGSAYTQIKRAIRSAAAEIGDERDSMLRLSNGLSDVLEKYRVSETLLDKTVDKLDAKLSPLEHFFDNLPFPVIHPKPKWPIPTFPPLPIPTYPEPKQNWLDDFWNGIKKKADKVKNKIHNTVENIKHGVAVAVDSAKDTVAGWIENYKEKGIVYKIVETGKAVIAIGTTVATLATLWGGALATGGVGAAPAMLATIYASNTITNNLVDLHNIWGGDINQVGKVNVLKDALKEGGGVIGEAVGNKELGEKVGEGLYTIGGVVNAASNMKQLHNKIELRHDQLIQSPSLFDSVKKSFGEVKEGASGMWDIITHSNISEIKYDLKLLSYEVPNITQAIATGTVWKDFIEKSYKLGKSIIHNGMEVVSVF